MEGEGIVVDVRDSRAFSHGNGERHAKQSREVPASPRPACQVERRRKRETWMKVILNFVTVIALVALASGAALAQTRPQLRALGEGAGARLFGDVCQSCHGNPQVRGAMSPATMKLLTPERIYEALTTGAMKTQAQNL